MLLHVTPFVFYYAHEPQVISLFCELQIMTIYYQILHGRYVPIPIIHMPLKLLLQTLYLVG